MKKIVSFFGECSDIFVKLNAKTQSYAEQKGFAYEWAPQTPFSEKSVISHLKTADVGIIDIQPYGEDIFREIDTSTKLLVRFGVGYDKVDLPAASRHGIAVARTTGANTLGVAEMALTLLLAARRGLKNAQRQVDAGVWEKTVVSETIGSTIGILGFGAIGRALTGLLSGLGCEIVAYDPYLDEKQAAELNVRAVGLEELFRISDAVSIHTPYTPSTHHLVGKELLSIMKPTAVLVNTARGGIVDEDALYEALASKKIRGAALDVFEEEPLPVTSPLLKLDNLLLSPHLSSQTEESLWRIYKLAVDIAEDFFAGKGSPHILNPDYAKGGSSK